MIIRPLCEADSFDELTELLHRAYARFKTLGLNVTAVDQTVEKTCERCAGGLCLVAEVDGRLVGTIKLNPPDLESEAPEFHAPDIALINQLAADPNASERGVGWALHNAAIVEARRWGARALLLDTPMGVPDLLALYESWGYRVVGDAQWSGKNYRSYLLELTL